MTVRGLTHSRNCLPPSDEMMFSDDLNTIAGGQNESYTNAEGTELASVSRFGPKDRLCYWRRGAFGIMPTVTPQP